MIWKWLVFYEYHMVMGTGTGLSWRTKWFINPNGDIITLTNSIFHTLPGFILCHLFVSKYMGFFQCLNMARFLAAHIWWSLFLRTLVRDRISCSVGDLFSFNCKTATRKSGFGTSSAPSTLYHLAWELPHLCLHWSSPQLHSCNDSDHLAYFVNSGSYYQWNPKNKGWT